MTLRRGFKSEANWLARDVRDDLGIAPHLPLCPWKLADRLGFPVVPLSKFAGSEPSAVAYLGSTSGQKDFSAITLFQGTKRLIIHNDSQGVKRQAANIAHELAHGILLHQPKPLLDQEGARFYDSIVEAEANWLGPALLVSEEAALHIARLRLPVSKASDIYGASEELVRMRLNVTAAISRARRAPEIVP
jgi:Zn-dependent peptidase ImmA (M78 family)